MENQVMAGASELARSVGKRAATQDRATPAPYPIEDGIPIPPYGHQRYPWDKLAVGQSFYVPLDGQADTVSLQNSLLRCAHNKGLKVTTRRENNGVRVWRVQ